MRKKKTFAEVIAENTRLLAKIKKVPMYKVEDDLGFSDGYLRRKHDDFPLSRMLKLAEYFGVGAEKLWDEEFTKEAQKMAVKDEISRLNKELEDMENGLYDSDDTDNEEEQLPFNFG